MKLDMRPKLVPWISRPERPKRRHAADEGAKNCNCKCNSSYEWLYRNGIVINHFVDWLVLPWCVYFIFVQCIGLKYNIAKHRKV